MSIAAAVTLASASGSRSAATALTLPTGFQESVVFSNLTAPTNVRFASDGRVFVAQKNGMIKEFDSLTDPTATTVIDLGGEVQDFYDRGLLGLALDPNFPTSPYIYALETYDALPGGTAPKWGDGCPSPPGPTTDGCVVTGRLLRLTLTGNTATSTAVLIRDEWCQQYPSHSIGDLNFGADGSLYVSGGDGASYTFADYGQGGGGSGSPTPKNPCGDPPAPVGGNMTPPTAEGGALRSQSVRRPSGEPVLLGGAMLRVDPATGNGLPSNPLGSSSSPNARRLVAYGLRNPFRFTIRPLTNELWIGDVGWNNWEEINRQPSPTSSLVNFGWPCYEGSSPQAGYQSAGLNLCSSLYSAGTATPPYYAYNHSAAVAAGDGCPTGSSSITGLAFNTGAGNYPAAYAGGLFFADYSRKCIWLMPQGGNGLPDPTRVQAFESGGPGPVDLEIGPNGNLFYVDLIGGTIRQIAYQGGNNNPPTAIATATPTSGPTPLTVSFDGSSSFDPDGGDTITYSWDLNGDGTFGDSTVAKPSFTYSTAGTYNAALRVTDNHGASTTSSPVTISATTGGTSTFGTTTPGPNTDGATSDLKEVSKYSAPQAGNVLKVTGYIAGVGSGTQPVRAVLYADSGGNPGALLGVSNQVTVTGGQPWGWVDFTFPSQVPIQAGTIWMGYIAGAQNGITRFRYDTVTNDLRYNANSGGYSAGPSNPFGSATVIDFHYSLYATYVPAGSPPPNNPPTASATATPTSGAAPLTVNFDGSASSDPNPGDTISYSWDLNGDGTFGDATVAKPSYTYTTAGTFSAKLRVTDNHGASATSSAITISVTGGGGGSSTFGTTIPGTSVDSATADNKEASKFTAPQAGSVTKVTGYISGLGKTSGTQPIRAVLYADSGGNPGALLGVSNQVTVTAGQAWGWVDFTFPSPVTIQAGTIWMGYVAGSTSDLIQLRYDSLANDLRYNQNTYAAGASSPFGGASTIGFHYSIYATYAAAGSNQPPVPTISSPPSTLTWKVGDLITFSGGATDPQDGTLPASALSWLVLLHHCDPTGQTCHVHEYQTFAGVSGGSFNAPDHGYPAHLEIQLTATDTGGLSASTSVTIEPQPVNLTFASSPSGLQLVLDGASQATPFTTTQIIGSIHSISAPASQTLGGTTYGFFSWSDGLAATHNITAPATAATWTATYTAAPSNAPPVANATATPTSGTAPLTVSFNGSGSSDPDPGDTISYSWDLNGDGTFGDSTVANPSFTYTAAGAYNAVLKVTDNHGASTLSPPIAITVNSVTFGTTTPGSSFELARRDVKEVSRFTAPQAGSVRKVTFYLSGLGATSGSQKLKAVLYADSGGNPGTRLGVSGTVTVLAGRPWGWVDFTFTTPVSIQAGTIWMGLLNGTKNNLAQLRYGPVAGDGRWNSNSYSSGASNPFGSSTTNGFHYSIYATYS